MISFKTLYVRVRLFIEVQIIGYDLSFNNGDVFMYRSV